LSQNHIPFALPIGTVISGFEIIRVLGVGGFGITYEGYNPVTKRKAAIKEFFPRGIASRDNATQVVFSRQDQDVVSWALERFRRSTTELCDLRHPNIVDVLNYVPANETGYMFMEQVEGETLEQWLSRKGDGATYEELHAIIDPICDALEYVHKRQFIHRDIAPDNIMIRADGRPMLIDFGAIKVIAQTTQTKAASGRSYGVAKQHYSPPEQLDDEGVLDPRADIYAIGAVLYRAAAGKPPVDADKRKNDLILKGQDSYVPLAQVTKMPLPDSLVKTIDRALSLRPGERPASIAEFRAGMKGEAAPPAPDDDKTELGINEGATRAIGTAFGNVARPQEAPAQEPVRRPPPRQVQQPPQANAVSPIKEEPEAKRRGIPVFGIVAIAAVVLIIGGVFLSAVLFPPATGPNNNTNITDNNDNKNKDTKPKDDKQPGPGTTNPAARAQIERGDKLRNDGKHDDAVQAFSEAIRLDPKSAEAYRKRAEAWAFRAATTTEEQYEISIRDLNRALELAGNNLVERLDTLKVRAQVYGFQGKQDKQIDDLTEVIRAEPSSAENYDARGDAYATLGRHDLAVTDYTRAIRLNPKQWTYYSSRALSNKLIKDYIASVADYSDAIALHPNFASLYAWRGEVHVLRNDFDKALSDYGEAIRRETKNMNFYRDRAKVYVQRADRAGANRRDDLSRARADYDVILRDSGAGAGDYAQRGLILEKLGLRMEAISDFRAALARDSSNGDAQAGLRRLGG